ncbi:MAG: dienelactone hydrolase family protein [Beijerinckiaceae bacterium]|nr:dienelactone hydrolase family protein [Beijerinckiaceae bacterium]
MAGGRRARARFRGFGSGSGNRLIRSISAERDFRAAIAFYPGACSEKLQSKPFTEVEPNHWTSRTPLLVLMGEVDNWTRVVPCRSFLDDARSRGNPVEMKSYPRAVHGFDAPNADRRELPAYRLDDGTVPVVETDDEARADAVLRSLAFLKEHFAH